MISVFVYGTLLVGESNHGVVSPFMKHAEPGVIHGRLYDVGPYPALVRTEDNHQVVGEWLDVTEEGLIAMDELEMYYGPGHPNNEYERVWVKDVHNQREGWVYCWRSPRGLPEIQGSSWKAHRQSNGL
ncbi:gamma-glutamylcyclotransferase family protein [Paenibacillus roseipurpureus]|uniref:Gamma-glutamylcyclotransferase family protein n=2 Tax=Paenibacillus roseopurpureus TaxID=2918901 RepID=A0AA96RL66_9BACL|nr:gamma-glutamylcyclotransferase family protein [Paenibacillus sp. MBLB1832]WNR47133.1 gamma-glutamylcyclotransferase family protein [Paenibacillus sp. MBLB1832]